MCLFSLNVVYQCSRLSVRVCIGNPGCCRTYKFARSKSTWAVIVISVQQTAKTPSGLTNSDYQHWPVLAVLRNGNRTLIGNTRHWRCLSAMSTCRTGDSRFFCGVQLACTKMACGSSVGYTYTKILLCTMLSYLIWQVGILYPVQ